MQMAGNSSTIEQYNEQRQAEQFEAKAIVRKFSIEIAGKEPDNFMAQSLVEYTELEEAEDTGEEIAVVQARAWSLLYEPSKGEAGNDDDVAIESQLLNKVWQEFIQELDQNETKKKNKKKRWLEYCPIKGELTIDSLTATVLEAATDWESQGQGKIQKYFHKFSANIHSHSVLLDILPSQSQYGSIFVGSLKTLIQASVNHEKVAEILSESLAKITVRLNICVTQARLYGTDIIKNGVERIYARIFQFIRTAIEWYRSSSFKRAIKSMSAEFPKQLESQVTDIMEIADEVHEMAQAAHGAETRDSRITGEWTADNVACLKRTAERTERKVDEFTMAWSREAKLDIGHSLANFLRRDIYTIVHDATLEGVKAGIAASSNRHMIEEISARELLPASLPTTQSMEALRSACAALQNHTHDQPEPQTLLTPSGLYLENNAVSALQAWSESAVSRTLWISTGRSSIHPAISSRIAASVANAASRATIPVVWFHYWPLASDGSFEGFEQEERALISVLYTLIRQVIDLSPNSLDLSDLSVEKLQSLDGTLETWDEGLRILSSALALGPPLLLLILDGLEHIDDTECGEGYLEGLLSLLRRASQNSDKDGSGNALKLLFTTTRDCSALNTVMDDDEDEDDNTEIVRCQTRRARISAGKMRAGRSRLRPFGSIGSESSDDEDDSGVSGAGY